jgi:hypothetical protein
MLTLEPINTDPVQTTSASVFLHPHPRPRQSARIIDLPDQRVCFHTCTRSLTTWLTSTQDRAFIRPEVIHSWSRLVEPSALTTLRLYCHGCG